MLELKAEACLADANSNRKSGQFRITTAAVAIAGAISSTPCTCCSAGATRRVVLA